MADEGSADDAPITFNIKSSNDTKYTITVSPSSTVAELKEKLSTKDFADIPADRQRLIYSGRVLKDAETIASYKIQPGNTVHLVKGAASNARQNPANAGAPAVPALPTNLSSGTGNNPLAGLTGARYAGFAQLPSQDMFGPDGGMGPPPDPEDMMRMLQNPQFASTLNEALSNPQLVDTMIQQNPLLRQMGPQVRQMLQSPEFRRMMTDPEQLRSMMQMQRMFGAGAGGGPFGMGGGAGGSSFPAPGEADTTPASQQTGGQRQANQQQPQMPPFNPFAALGQAQGNQGGAAGANPFAALFNPAMFGNTPAQTPPAAASAGQGTPTGQDPASVSQNTNNTTQSTTTATNPPANQQQTPQYPFPMYNPQMLQQFLSAMNPSQQPGGHPTSTTDTAGANSNPAANPTMDPSQNPFAALMNPWFMNNMGGAGAGGFGGFGGPQTANPPAPADTRPPEERYAEQLRQLNEMGFYEFERNVEALRRTGGSVQGAVEYLLTH